LCIKVIPQKFNLPMNFFEIFPESSLLSTVSKKNNKNDRSSFALKRYDGPILPHLCLYYCLSRALFIGSRYVLRLLETYFIKVTLGKKTLQVESVERIEQYHIKFGDKLQHLERRGRKAFAVVVFLVVICMLE